MFDLKKLVVILFIFIFSSGMVYAANETNVDSSNPNLVNDDLLKTDIDDSSLCDGNISQYAVLPLYSVIQWLQTRSCRSNKG